MRFKLVLLVLLLGLPHCIIAKEIITGHWQSIDSKILNEKRDFAVYLPPSYQNNESEKYPTLYLLDGDETRFKGLVGLVESLSTNNLGRQIPEFIIIAIPNTNRNRDLTPTAVNFMFKEQLLDEIKSISGGAKNFALFFEKELFPYMNNNYRTNDSRTLVGESFGGLFAAHIMLSKPQLFESYLITDATYIWHDNFLNRSIQKIKTLSNTAKVKAYLSLANNDHLGEIGITNQKWGRQFIKNLKSLNSDTIKTKSQYFANETHGTVALLSWYHGLLYLFKEQSKL
jgi:predicted alpha/beta superfamily hydrolase